MTHLVTILLLTVAFTFCAISQTEVWRLPGTYYSAVNGDNGNIFIAQGNRYATTLPDTIKKISPSGSVLNEVEVNLPIKEIIFNGGGLYALFSAGSEHDSLKYFDTDLNTIWVGSVPQYFHNRPAVDKSGNLYCLVSNPMSLMKITPTGLIAFRKNLVRPVLNNIEDEIYFGPYIDANGMIYVVGWFMNAIFKEGSSGYTSTNNGYYYAYKTDTTTTTPFTQTVILKKDKVRLEKETERGGENFELENPTYLLDNITIANGRLVLGGTYNYSLNKYSESSVKEEYLSQWRMMVVGTDGKSKKFSYKGKGVDACKEDGWSFKTDNGMNYLGLMGGVGGDIVTLVGRAARGKVKCGEGELYYDDVVMGYNTATKKIAWTVKVADIHYKLNVYFKESGKIFIPMSFTSYQVFDANGSMGSILTFPEPFWDYYGVGSLQEINKKDGVLYLNRLGPDGRYFAKYALPAMKFTPPTFSDYTEQPMEFELQQNYPNPFNPSTTISFALPYASSVTLKIYNMLGQEVATVLDRQDMEEGIQEIEFSTKGGFASGRNASGLPSGVYFYRIVAEGISTEESELLPERFVDVKKMILLK